MPAAHSPNLSPFPSSFVTLNIPTKAQLLGLNPSGVSFWKQRNLQVELFTGDRNQGPEPLGALCLRCPLLGSLASLLTREQCFSFTVQSQQIRMGVRQKPGPVLV
ncbi:hypothetical protein H1C71_021567 [Ictidomys tridecemlineatus]|nr:hypothetical protein H1C71_021567 [Ictidomys tridecemlineatus]